MNINQTLKERGSTHGEYAERSRVSQNIKKAMLDSLNWELLSDSQKESLDMVAHKISRILTGDANHHEHWHDIIGYTKLVADKLDPNPTT